VTALNLNNSGSNSNWNIGFRCARPRFERFRFTDLKEKHEANGGPGEFLFRKTPLREGSLIFQGKAKIPWGRWDLRVRGLGRARETDPAGPELSFEKVLVHLNRRCIDPKCSKSRTFKEPGYSTS